MIRIPGSLLGLLLVPALAAAQPNAREVVFKKDIVYGKGGDIDLALDLAMPKEGKGPFPAVVCIHGGAWQAGHRGAHHGAIRLLAGQGYVAATVTYRLAPKHRWPAQIEDVKCAVRFLRTRAKEYQVDPERIAALGDSAGGHLALLLGLMDAKSGFEGNGGHAEQSSQVQAVVNYYGPTNFRTWAVTPLGEILLKVGVKKSSADLLKDLVGTADRRAEVMATISPITYASKQAPPILTFNGTQDVLVPHAQAIELHDRLKKLGVLEQLEILDGAPHGWGGELKQKTDRTTLEFLDRHLKKKKSP